MGGGEAYEDEAVRRVRISVLVVGDGTMNRQKCGGYTVIEAVIVIFIVMFLMMLILPAIALAKGAARQMHCSANLGKIGVASEAFAMDHKGYLPLNYMHVKGRMQTWEGMVEPYVEQVWMRRVSVDGEEVREMVVDPYRCPLSEEGSGRKSDYAQNSFELSASYLTPAEMDLRRPVYIPIHPEMEYLPSFGWYRTPLRVAEVQRPSEVYARADSTKRDWNVSDRSSVVGRHGGKRADEMGGTLNVQFWDGHVALYEKEGIAWEDPGGKMWQPYEGFWKLIYDV